MVPHSSTRTTLIELRRTSKTNNQNENKANRDVRQLKRAAGVSVTFSRKQDNREDMRKSAGRGSI